jgi:hypothetical protein
LEASLRINLWNCRVIHLNICSSFIFNRTLPTPPTLTQWKEALRYNKDPNQYLSRHQTTVKQKMCNFYMQMFILYVFVLPILFTYIELSFWLKSTLLILPFVSMMLLTWKRISTLTAFPNGPLSYMFNDKTLNSEPLFSVQWRFPQRDRLEVNVCALIPFYISIVSLLYFASGESG